MLSAIDRNHCPPSNGMPVRHHRNTQTGTTKSRTTGPKSPAGRVTGATVKDAQPVDRHVGSRVRMRRMMVGMSQEKLGEACGITFQQIQKYEKGTNRMGA